MPRLIPRMTTEPPAEYVAFVARHLTPLRLDSARVAGDADSADELSGGVLTAVAIRWWWLELLRTRLGRSRAAEEFLDRAFAQESGRRDADPFGDETLQIEVSAWTPVDRDDGPPPERRVLVSNAVRLAPLLLREERRLPGPVCEAAIAWWHAYEARRRQRILAVVGIGLLLLALLARVSAPPV